MIMDSGAQKEWSRLRRLASQQPIVSAGEEPALLERANAGDAAALARLVESHRRLVVEIACRHARAGIPPSDLVGEGMVGLVEAIRRSEPGHSARLSTYARWWIRARVRAYALANRNIVALPSTRNGRRTLSELAKAERALVRELGRAPMRREIAAQIGVQEADVDAVVSALAARDVTLGAPGEDGALELSDETNDPERLVADSEQRKLLRNAVRGLPVRQRVILHAQLEDEDVTFSEMARTIGVSAQRTSQLAAEARQSLRDAFSVAS